jgi:DNA modification methylase
MSNLKIEYIPISEVIPYDNNPRKNDGAVDIVMKSISENGFKNPIILDKNNVIIAGHTRLKAALKLGLIEVPVIWADDLTDEQVKAFRIMDNKSSEYAEWDLDLLKTELEELKNLNVDLDLSGFSEVELNKLIPEETEEHFEEPKEAKYKIQKGDIYQLGNHRLMCGDCTIKENVGKLMDGQKADMVFTDPPYSVSIGKKNRDLQSVGIAVRNTDDLSGDDLDVEEISEKLWKPAFSNMANSLKEGSGYYVTAPQGGDQMMMMMMMMMMRGSMPCRHELIWIKSSPTFSLGRLDYSYQHEPILYGWIGKNRRFYGINERSIWEIDKAKKSIEHPTMKPVELMVKAIKNSSKENEIVLDIFGGSGSTLIACEQTNRKCYMMELDEFYCSVIIERWENLTGKKAVKL